MNKKIKLYYFAPHPVQYHVGIYRELSKLDNLDFRVMKMMLDVNMKNFNQNPFEGYVTLSDWFLISSKLTKTKIIFKGEATFKGNGDKTF